MALVYDDEPRQFNGAIRIDQMDPHPQYLKHLGNKFYLEFIHQNGTVMEKFQAGKELKICDRKLAFWSRHPRFIWKDVEPDIAKLKSDWRRT